MAAERPIRTPTLFLICGLPGAGKTTLARRLERERPALRLTPDEWLMELYGDDRAKVDPAREAIEALQWGVALRALALGVDVVLDWGVWSRRERGALRAQAEAVGAQVELCYLEVPRAELWARIAARNAARPAGTFHIDKAEFESWWDLFEPPATDEVE
ncbi:MAG TPA: ATP-binding protein [Limnochordia bacterium]|nr:ATP-binding protein [Limnochordia bacterium]